MCLFIRSKTEETRSIYHITVNHDGIGNQHCLIIIDCFRQSMMKNREKKNRLKENKANAITNSNIFKFPIAYISRSVARSINPRKMQSQFNLYFYNR